MADIQVRKNITLYSPSGKSYTALWAGGTRTVKKRLAMYSYAGINGQVVDDYGCDSITYPIQLIFSGENHKLTAKEFMQSFLETGKWEIYHPTEGFLPLQGVEATENDQPIKEAGITKIDTQWIDYIDPLTLRSLRNVSIELGILTQELDNDDVQFAQEKMDDSPAGVEEANVTARNIATKVIQGYNKSQYFLQEAVDAQEQLLDDINMGFVLATGMLKSVQNIIKAPARGIADLKARIRTMKSILEDIFDEDNDPIEPNYNDARVKEITVSAAFSSFAEGVVTSIEGEESGLESRSELLYTIDEFNDMVDIAQAGLDRIAVQNFNQGVKVENAFIPFEDTNIQVKEVISKTNKILKEQYFKLPVETKLVTKKPMTILDIVKEYYGGVGDDDEILDKIEQTNTFTNTELLLIPAGTTVRVYG